MSPRFPQGELKFNKWLVKEYFKHGSVDEVLRVHRFSLPLSYATYQRILDKWKVVKVAGPNNKFNEAVEFFSHLAIDNLPIESLYKKIPLRFQTSVTTFYRILEYVKEGITRRVGVGLIITPYDSEKKILVAKDISLPRIELGKSFASLSLPMGYSRKRDSKRVNILRILQQEVFTDMVIERKFPEEIVSLLPEPFMYLDIADVRVAIYHLQLPKSLTAKSNFTSFKLCNFNYMNIEEILEKKKEFRVGVREAVLGYKKYLNLLSRNLSANPIQEKSVLNKELATVTVDLEV